MITEPSVRLITSGSAPQRQPRGARRGGGGGAGARLGVPGVLEAVRPHRRRGQIHPLLRGPGLVQKSRDTLVKVGHADDWRTYLDLALDRHARKYKLVPMLKQLQL
jgi:hypothetical protein